MKFLESMEFKIKISSTASKNIEEAVEYYNRHSKASAKNFKKKVKEGFEVLKVNPFFIVRYGEVRVLPLKKIPYILLFDVDNKKRRVNILSVFCTHQNPEKYPK